MEKQEPLKHKGIKRYALKSNQAKPDSLNSIHEGGSKDSKEKTQSMNSVQDDKDKSTVKTGQLSAQSNKGGIRSNDSSKRLKRPTTTSFNKSKNSTGPVGNWMVSNGKSQSQGKNKKTSVITSENFQVTDNLDDIEILDPIASKNNMIAMQRAGIIPQSKQEIKLDSKQSKSFRRNLQYLTQKSQKNFKRREFSPQNDYILSGNASSKSALSKILGSGASHLNLNKAKTRVNSGSSERRRKRKASRQQPFETKVSNPRNSVQLAMREVDVSMNTFTQSFGKDYQTPSKTKSNQGRSLNASPFNLQQDDNITRNYNGSAMSNIVTANTNNNLELQSIQDKKQQYFGQLPSNQLHRIEKMRTQKQDTLAEKNKNLLAQLDHYQQALIQAAQDKASKNKKRAQTALSRQRIVASEAIYSPQRSSTAMSKNDGLGSLMGNAMALSQHMRSQISQGQTLNKTRNMKRPSSKEQLIQANNMKMRHSTQGSSALSHYNVSDEPLTQGKDSIPNHSQQYTMNDGTNHRTDSIQNVKNMIQSHMQNKGMENLVNEEGFQEKLNQFLFQYQQDQENKEIQDTSQFQAEQSEVLIEQRAINNVGRNTTTGQNTQQSANSTGNVPIPGIFHASFVGPQSQEEESETQQDLINGVQQALQFDIGKISQFRNVRNITCNTTKNYTINTQPAVRVSDRMDKSVNSQETQTQMQSKEKEKLSNTERFQLGEREVTSENQRKPDSLIELDQLQEDINMDNGLKISNNKISGSDQGQTSPDFIQSISQHQNDNLQNKQQKMMELVEEFVNQEEKGVDEAINKLKQALKGRKSLDKSFHKQDSEINFVKQENGQTQNVQSVLSPLAQIQDYEPKKQDEVDESEVLQRNTGRAQSQTDSNTINQKLPQAIIVQNQTQIQKTQEALDYQQQVMSRDQGYMSFSEEQIQMSQNSERNSQNFDYYQEMDVQQQLMYQQNDMEFEEDEQEVFEIDPNEVDDQQERDQSQFGSMSEQMHSIQEEMIPLPEVNQDSSNKQSFSLINSKTVASHNQPQLESQIISNQEDDQFQGDIINYIDMFLNIPSQTQQFDESSPDSKVFLPEFETITENTRFDLFSLNTMNHKFVLTQDNGFKDIVEDRSQLITTQTDKSNLPKLNKKLKASRKKNLLLTKKQNTQVYAPIASPLVKIGDLDVAKGKSPMLKDGSIPNFESDEEEDKQNIEQRIQASVQFAINEHAARLPNNKIPMLLMHKTPYQDKLLELKFLQELPRDEQLIAFKSQLPKHLMRDENNKKDWESYLRNKHYDDIVWKNKNFPISFVLIEDTDLIDNVKNPVSLFDVKTNSSSMGAYNELNWDLIDHSVLNVERLMTNSKLDYRFIEQMNLSLDGLQQQWEAIRYRQHQRQLVSIPSLCMRSLIMIVLGSGPRFLPLQMRFKTAVCVRDLQSYIQNKLFSVRLPYLSAQMDFERKNQFNELQQQIVLNKHIKIYEGSDFKESHAHALLAMKGGGSKSINKILFRYSQCSLYKKLYDPDNDYSLRNILKYLHQKHISEKMRETNQIKITPIPKQRRNSIPVNQVKYNRRHYNDKEEAFGQCIQNREWQSEDDAVEWIPIKRSNAQDKYNKEYAAFVIEQKLEARLQKVKDSMEMFYNRLECIIDDDDQEYNQLSKQFGYKCNLIRDIRRPSTIFEVYLPTLKVTGQRKIDLEELRMAQNNPKSHLNSNTLGGNKVKALSYILKQSEQSTTQHFQASAFKSPLIEAMKQQRAGKQLAQNKMIDLKKQQKGEQINKPRNVIMRKIIVDEFDTDDSMQDIRLEEINKYDQKEESQQDLGSTKKRITRKKSRGIKQFLDTNYQSAYEYYKKHSENKAQSGAFSDDKIKSESTMKPIYYKVLDISNQSKNEGNENFYQQLRQKVQVDGIISQMESDVFKDNQIHYRLLQGQLDYLQKVRNLALEKYKMSENDYLQNCRALESNIVSMEEKLLDQMEIISSNFQFHYSDVTQVLEQQFGNQLRQFMKDSDKIETLLDKADEREDLSSDEDGDNKNKSDENSSDRPQILTASANFSDLNESKLIHNSSSKRKQLIEKTKRLISFSSIDENEEFDKNDQQTKKKLLGMDSDFEEENEFQVYSKIKKQKQEFRKQNEIIVKKSQKELFRNQIKSLSTVSLSKPQKQQIKRIHKEKKVEIGIVNHMNIYLKQMQKNYEQNMKSIEANEDYYDNPWGQFKPVKFQSVEWDTIESSVVNQVERPVVINSENTHVNSSVIEKHLPKYKPVTKSEFGSTIVHHNTKYQDMMIDSIESHNYGLLENILKVFNGSIENILDEKGNNLIAMATLTNDAKMIKLLLTKAGLDVNQQNYCGDTALHLALSNGFMRCVEPLIQNDADEKIVNIEGLTPWDMKQ